MKQMVKQSINKILFERSEITNSLHDLQTIAKRKGYYAYNPTSHKLVTGMTYQDVDEKAISGGLIPAPHMLVKGGFVHGSVTGREILVMGSPLLVRAFIHQLFEVRHMFPFSSIRLRSGDTLDLMNSNEIVSFLR